MVVTPATDLLVGVGASLRFAAGVLDANGSPVDGVPVSWSTADPSVATVDGSGLVTAVSSGMTTVEAVAGEAAGSASIEVYVPPVIDEYVPGQTYFGRNRYVEYIAGHLPVIISAPHGGGEEPDEIPLRTYGTLGRDLGTQETIRAVRDSLFAYSGGGHPHIVISLLRRTKLDPNREIVEAAQGSPFAEQAWREFQRFIEVARARVAQDQGRGLYLDLHGHGHPVNRIELGYLLTAADLAQSDEMLSQQSFADKSSIRALAGEGAISFAELVRGPESFGEFLSREAAISVPSPFIPDPGNDPFFSGGYNTRVHGSVDGDPIDGIQVELHLPGVRGYGREPPALRGGDGPRTRELPHRALRSRMEWPLIATRESLAKRGWPWPSSSRERCSASCSRSWVDTTCSSWDRPGTRRSSS